MTPGERIRALAQLTLKDPRRATHALLAEGVPMRARTAGLLLVAVVSAVLAIIQAEISPQPMDPLSAFMLASPFRAAVMQWVFLALSVVLVYRVGRAFGGYGSFPDALLVVVWLQFLLLALQVVQLPT
ncbi:MAG: YIP1 family protein, partial [Acetobacteraceae bacterium]